jgi:aminomethyltransferase
MAVRTAAGLFDVSHMGELEVEGPGAVAFLQRVTSNNVGKLADGQAQYSALPLPNGAPADDVIVYRRGPERFLVVVNAGNIEKDLRWLEEQAPAQCVIKNRSDEYALIALQGPKSPQILQGLTGVDLSALRYYHFAEGEVAGHQVMIARTGYTGEDGFELFVAPDRAADLWRKLLEAGKDAGLVPAGLGARDTLRLEAKMCLYGNDMDETTTLVEAGLGWIVSLDEAKGDFVGRGVLEAQRGSWSASRWWTAASPGTAIRSSSATRPPGRSRRAATRRSCRRTSACATCPRPGPWSAPRFTSTSAAAAWRPAWSRHRSTSGRSSRPEEPPRWCPTIAATRRSTNG